MSDLNTVANRVGAHVSAKEGSYSIDPLTISIIITIITNLIKLWWSCRSEKKVRSELQNPSWLFRLFLKREIRKHSKGKQREILFGAFMDVAPTLSEKEINNILKEIGETE
jgi:hypothetical protein